jgi:hypothetical protein
MMCKFNLLVAAADAPALLSTASVAAAALALIIDGRVVPLFFATAVVFKDETDRDE